VTRACEAHRLSTVRAADLIGVLDDGAILELGSHDEFLASGGRYAQLSQLQQVIGTPAAV
jgi:ABC-type multidrug transport system fused ATPase/permease subunit